MKTIALTYTLLICFLLASFAQHQNQPHLVNTTALQSTALTTLTHSNYNYNVNVLRTGKFSNTQVSDFTINSNHQHNQDLLSVSLAHNTSTTTHNTVPTEIMTPSDYIIWGNNGADTSPNPTAVAINLSANATLALETTVSYTAMQRIWRFIQMSEDTPTVTLRIPQEAITTNAAIGKYYMLISDSETFDASADYKIMTADGNGNLEADYNFTDHTFITFGFSPQVSAERSIYFNGTDDFIDMDNKLDLNPLGFTISAWINHKASNTSVASILSKRDTEFSQGYDVSLTDAKQLNITWKNNTIQSLTSTTTIPENEWHHIAITYNGTELAIYIDGVLDKSATRTAPIATNQDFYLAAAGQNTVVQHFKGHLDEIRIWNTHLSEDQLRFVMNQEIKNSSGNVIGQAVPLYITKNEVKTIPWSDLAAYYPMSNFTYKTILDATGNENNGRLKNLLSVDKETAPLPYTTAQDGDWNTPTTWTNGHTQHTPGSASIVDPNITVDWNIVRTAHRLTLSNTTLPNHKNNNRTLLGLYVDANQLIVNGDTAGNTGNGLTITHHLELTGKIDLEGESQLIQTVNSDLKVISNGTIERDQQGTADTFTYNYWSSPVTKANTNVQSFKISDVMLDGTTNSNPLPITFASSGYNGSASHPIKIADYWIWKYANLVSNNYSAWQHLRQTGRVLPGEGFTMKGPGTGTVSNFQNYVFSGKPNNGDVKLTLSANNDYLVGNPYPSAIDAVKFILDNGPQAHADGSVNPNATPLISGSLYYWNHWGGGTHALQDYQGGYATFNLSGSVAAAYKRSNHPALSHEGSPTKKPERAIAVGQGFFVIGQNSGTITFNNGQRIFNREGGNSSVFMRSATNLTAQINTETVDLDTRMKFRIGFSSVNTINRQLLLTIDDNATPNVDWAYDSILYENQMDDMYWRINDESFIIQASNEAEIVSSYPLGIKTATDGINTIRIDALENVPSNINVYLHDMVLNSYHDLRTGDYNVFLNAGNYHNRFAITFGRTDQELLGSNAQIEQHIDVRYSTAMGKLIIVNPNGIEVKNITVFNLLGQSVYSLNNIENSTYSEYSIKNLSTGPYIIKLQSATNAVVTKKIIVD